MKNEKNGWYKVSSFLLKVSNAEKVHKEVIALKLQIQLLETNFGIRIEELEKRVEVLEQIASKGMQTLYQVLIFFVIIFTGNRLIACTTC